MVWFIHYLPNALFVSLSSIVHLVSLDVLKWFFLFSSDLFCFNLIIVRRDRKSIVMETTIIKNYAQIFRILLRSFYYFVCALFPCFFFIYDLFLVFLFIFFFWSPFFVSFWRLYSYIVFLCYKKWLYISKTNVCDWFIWIWPCAKISFWNINYEA